MSWLTPEEASKYLWEKFRLKRNERRLGQLRYAGTGPLFHRNGLAVRYHQNDLDAWGLKQLGQPIASTSQESEAQAPTLPPAA
jgi:hypothetical protein